MRIEGVERGDEPFDRLTWLAEQITSDLLDRPEYADVKCIVFLEDSERSGIKVHGYSDQTSALVALFVHMKAMFNAMGKDLEFVSVPDTPADLG